MEPLKPVVKNDILQSRPNVTHQDIEEYERLLAQRFTIDPQAQKTFEQSAGDTARNARIKELHEKLFGAGG